jgi:hypothetical protein
MPARPGLLATASKRLSGPFRKSGAKAGARLASVLDQRRVDYAAMSFPNSKVTELLVDDEHVERVADLKEIADGLAVRLYTTGGCGGAYYRAPRAEDHPRNHIAVFPPYLGKEIIEGARPGADGLRVLAPRESFLTCAFRAAYMEPESWTPGAPGGEDYRRELKTRAAAAEIRLPDPLTPADLDEILASEGWRPPIDLLEKAGREWAPWIRTSFPDLFNHDGEAPGLAVFFIREEPLRSGLLPEILETLTEKGCEPLRVIELDESQRERAARSFRGGNWGRITYPASGGRPACIVVAYDLLPRPISDKYRDTYPACDNQKVVTAKKVARNLINSRLPADQRYNGVHSTDNCRQAWAAVRILLPGEERALRAEIEQRRRDFATAGGLRELTRIGCRSKVELIDWNGTPAVRKTFRPSTLRYMQREIEVMEKLGPVLPEFPSLLDRGPNYIVMTYVGEDSLGLQKSLRRPMPFWAVRELSRIMKSIIAHGFDPIDLRPDLNVLFTPSGPRIIDFEFWRPCDPQTPPHEAKCFVGLPLDDTGERPRGVPYIYDPYRTVWYSFTQLDLHSFLYDPAWVQWLKRSARLTVNYPYWASKRLARRVLGSNYERLRVALGRKAR